MRKTLEERFWEKVNKTDTCWLWTAACNSTKYGVFRVDRTTLVLAHRMAFELEVGPLSDKVDLDHRTTCPKNCVNPAHLRSTTHKQNHENRAGATANNKTGVRGVWPAKHGKFQAGVKHNGKQLYVGTYSTVKEAEAAVVAKRLELFTHNDVDRIRTD